MTRADIVVVGAGMAGASLAAELAPYASVTMIEAEPQPGYHATGRSAAFWSQTYGGPAVQPLTAASEALLRTPPAGFAERGFLAPRGELHLADAAGAPALAAFEAGFADSGIAFERPDEDAIRASVPGLRAGPWTALLEPTTADIDVAALHAAYLRAARRAGARLACGIPVRAVERVRNGWRVDAGETVEARVLVDAAGAWADALARLAGVRPLGIRPYRRTVSQLRMAVPAAPDLPLVMDALGRFYFKPEAGGRLWLSPHDETPAAAGDAAPEEIDVATAIDRFGRVTAWEVAQVERSWAGLRSFAPDRLPVYGFAGDAPGFYWFAGQGGFGIQTAPAAARLAAAAILGRSPHASVAAIDPARYAAIRFGT